MGIFGETSEFYINKVKEEEGLLIRNTIIFSIVTIITFFFTFVIGLILLLLNVLIFRSLYNNMKENLEKIKNRYYPNGQLKWEDKFVSNIKGVTTYHCKSFYHNGKLKCEYTSEGSKITNKINYDENGKEIK
tara:strand:+ start:302 stop:697 length:396 start_codon:yes stop_codon:yes gene_type:complete